MIGALPDDHPVTTHHQLCLALGGDETSFTGDLLRLIAKADPGNRALLRMAFPKHVKYWEAWQRYGQYDKDPLTAAKLDALSRVMQ